MAIMNQTAPGTWAVTSGTTESLVILLVVTIVTAAAAYFTGTLYGKVGLYSIAAGYVLVVATLVILGGVRFG